MGIWFGAEVIQHFGEDDIDLSPPDSCVVLHIADITHEVSNNVSYYRSPHL
jgi:hypothetical protein